MLDLICFLVKALFRRICQCSLLNIIETAKTHCSSVTCEGWVSPGRLQYKITTSSFLNHLLHKMYISHCSFQLIHLIYPRYCAGTSARSVQHSSGKRPSVESSSGRPIAALKKRRRLLAGSSAIENVTLTGTAEEEGAGRVIALPLILLGFIF